MSKSRDRILQIKLKYRLKIALRKYKGKRITKKIKLAYVDTCKQTAKRYIMKHHKNITQ